jgi:GDPmannose 4,6-dehydratase
MTKNFRDGYNLFAVNGILFNHESPRRGANFVTRKIALGVAGIALGMASNIELGNLDSRRDWGHARDYMRGVHLMMQQPVPADYVLASGEARSVREFAEEAFRVINIELRCDFWTIMALLVCGLNADGS